MTALPTSSPPKVRVYDWSGYGHRVWSTLFGPAFRYIKACSSRWEIHELTRRMRNVKLLRLMGYGFGGSAVQMANSAALRRDTSEEFYVRSTAAEGDGGYPEAELAESSAPADDPAMFHRVYQEPNVLLPQDDPALDPLYTMIRTLLAQNRLEAAEERVGKLVELLLPAVDPMGEVMARMEIENANLRAEFLRSVPCFTADQLAAMAGHQAENNRVTGSRWKRSGKVFSVEFRGRDYYPAFQFDAGQPKPVIKSILEALPDGMTDWQTAFWFVSSCPWLDGAVPSQRLIDAPELVIAAARSEAAKVLG